MAQRFQHLFSLAKIREYRQIELRGSVTVLDGADAFPHQELGSVLTAIDETIHKRQPRANSLPESFIEFR